jgi:hypothetical protein
MSTDGGKSSLPSVQKLRDLPNIGKEKDELPYHKWKVDALAYIEAARAGKVLTTPPPGTGESFAYQEWFAQANAIVYASLLAAVRSVQVLGDAVRRLQGKPDSALKAWKAIEAHYVRMADTNLTYLMGKVRSLVPTDGESMESFLNRCQALRDEFDAYGLELEDHLLITQVFQGLSHQWKQSCGLNRVSVATLQWAVVAEMLQQEDNSRRQSNTKATDALLPLGWTRKHPGGAFHAKGEEEHNNPLSFPAAPRACACAGTPRDSGKGKRVKKEHNGGAVLPARKNFVCYHCLKSGHTWTHCRTRPAEWKPTAEDKQKADRIRDEREANGGKERPNGRNSPGATHLPCRETEGRVGERSV